MNLSMLIAEHAATVPSESVGERALYCAKRATLDTIGCMLAANHAPGLDVMVGLAREWGGKAEASVVGRGFAVPAPLAAWINGSMARALEIDDCTDFLPMHPSAAVVPALLALAEARPGVSGREFLAAVAIGQDLIIRLGCATRIDGIQSGRYNLFKIFGVAAAAARLLRLDATRTRHALGIAYALACGEAQSALDGALSFRTHEGNAGQSAITAAMMAERGFTGAADFLTGRMGFYTSFEPEPALEVITADLGVRFRGEELSFKPYAACRCTHTAIGLVLACRSEMSLDPQSVRRVRISVSPGVYKLVGAHLDGSTNADSQAAAQFSLPFTVAAALVRGAVFLAETAPDAIADPTIRALERRIEVHADEAMNDTRFVTGRTLIELELDGRPGVRLEGTTPPGNPANPVEERTTLEKFRKCAAWSAAPLGEARVESIIEQVNGLDSLPDTGELARILRGPAEESRICRADP